MPDVNTGWQTEDFTRVPRGPGTPFQYVFTPDSPPDRLFSGRVMLPEGRMYLFRAFNVPAGRSIFMNWVTPEYGGAGPFLDAPIHGRDMYVQRMTLGGADNWILSAERPQMLVNLPGVYRFELEDYDMLGQDLCLEYSCVRCVPEFKPGVTL